MPVKEDRRQLILRLIRAQPVRTQDELAAQLAEHGVAVSQVTLSRDLRELGVVKTANGYEDVRRIGAELTADADESLTRVLADFLKSAAAAGNLVVLKTGPGGAGAVALALDEAAWPEIVGTIAGDDTIFAATPNPKSAQRVLRRLTAAAGARTDSNGRSRKNKT